MVIPVGGPQPAGTPKGHQQTRTIDINTTNGKTLLEAYVRELNEGRDVKGLTLLLFDLISAIKRSSTKIAIPKGVTRKPEDYANK